MPTFVNDENSPIYANAGVVHLGNHHVPNFEKLSTAKDTLISRPLTTTIDTNETFDDNSSSHSSYSSDLRTRMDADGSTVPSMTPWPNGRSSKDSNGSASMGPNSKYTANMKAPLSRAESSEHQYTLNGVSQTTESQRKSTSESQLNRFSVESRVSVSVQPPVEQSRNSLNGTVSPDGSVPSYLPPSPLTPSTPNPDPTQRRSPPPQRFSGPPNYPSTSASASTPALQGPTGGLKHRHTLEVPRVQPGRGSRDSNDTAFASGRFSPTGAGPSQRRGSLNLGRRNTRSLHSEVPRDEILPDDDALRWAEAYRQKRAKKKKREEEDDDRVLVGTKVDENHANWTTAYNMLTGIRVSVSRTNAKLDRPLTDADFETKQKSTFDIAGNELVPSAKYDFKFKDYAPWVFRHLRALFRLDPADYLMSLTGKYILSELGSPGKSGSFFYFSRDYKYIIKTIHHGEHKFLRKILKDYYDHVTDNPNTLLSQFYGLHRVKMPYGKKIHFVVMNNLFPPHRDIHTTFDLKGSTVGRDYREEDLEKNPRATLKDLNWLRRKRNLELGIQKKQLFLQQLERDVRLLQKLKIMDYSLLIGIHDLQKGNEENLRGKTLQVFNPGGDSPSDEGFDPSSVLMRTPSKLENARKARELRQMIKAERPVPVGQTNTKMPDELTEGHGRGGMFYSDDGGLRATHENNTAGDEVYYLGVIDCLTHYGVIKKIEHFWKGLSSDRTQISALPPEEYGDRFIQFMTGITKSQEEALRDAHDRENAAIALAEMERAQQDDLQAPGPSGAPPAPTYLPPAPPGMRSPNSPEPNPTIEIALRRANERDGAKEEQVPERKITTAVSPGSRADSRAVLPVVEETAEAGSVGGRSQGDSASESRPYTPSPRERPDGFTNLGPHGIGGRGPPTPPKTSYLEPDGSFDGRKRSGSSTGSGGFKFLRHRFSRESLEKTLPPIPK
ncbi:SAICAR synthase-like protein [Annulohypoxylon maeteangense]|uniref:SAICAR synthase-like protein n=1 Tax=Annulohypoxylon maeteangense TaxID=1927788 RepID=UPI0020082EFC|nr:SAICAR synthase-like protein [Annulohypoxylon maeteangense]KAI0886502.1 SAICAR synthase-like protein [Annulohypoxylon maeteangense]